jgi:hypothetical protein
MSKPQRVRVTADWSQWLDVEQLLDFVELEFFTADWRRLRLDDNDLSELQVSIMLSPKVSTSRFGNRRPPRHGHADFFGSSNSRNEVDPLTLYGGAPVRAGAKWIATKWLRQHRRV